MNTPRHHHLIAFLTALLLVPGLVHAQDGTTDDANRPGAKRPGFYLAADIGGAAYSLDDAIGDRLDEDVIDLSDSGNGFGLALGYSWRNEFALELQAFGAALSTGNTDIDAGLGQFDLAFRAPLLPRSRLAPYLEAHLGGTVLGLEGDGINDRAVFGGTTGVGGGLEVHLGRRWALDFGYRFSLVSFQEETIERADGGDEDFEIDGTGHVHRLVLRTVFSF
jgi:opacity protein-like surface antigen